MGAPTWPTKPMETRQGGAETCTALDELEDESRERIEKMASELLWAWTGRKYGLTATTVRPCRETYAPNPYRFLATSGNGWAPVLIDGQWHNLSCGTCDRGKCGCDDRDARSIALPGPVDSITEITIDGEVLDPGKYRLVDGALLRTDGHPWPMSNDYYAPADGEGTWTVTYERGYPVPEGGQIAAGILACELAMALAHDDDCRLPRRVQSVTREGITMSILDGFEGLEDGKTGLWEIDAWIASANQPRPSTPRVYSPDMPRERGTARSMAVGYVGRR